MRSSNKQLITYCSHAQPSSAYSVHAMQSIKQYIQPRNTVKQSVTRCNQSVTQSPGHAFTQQFTHSVAQTHTCGHIQAPRYGKAKPTESKKASRLPGCLWVPPSARYLQATFPPVTLDETSQSIIPHTHAYAVNTLSLASARVHRDGPEQH